MSYSVCAVICSAGKGLRAGFDKNKLLVPFDGSCALLKALSAFDFPEIAQIVVTSSPEDLQEITQICKAFPQAKVVLGGETRSQSVYNALQETTADIVLIHDGARPFVTRTVIQNCIQSVKAFGSGICAVPSVDTTAVCKEGKIMQIPDRKTLYRIQTPQGFFTENIRTAYKLAFENGETDFTDDSAVFKRYCGLPTVCEGDEQNIKLTYPSDFCNAFAVGFGVDTHAFGKEQDYITLAGVRVPSHSGLIAHSDGDVLVHAVMDAILSACGLKDIGHYFPDTDEQWKDANSMDMLMRVRALAREQGYGVSNLSISVQAEKPRLAKYVDEMKNRLAGALNVDPTQIGLGAGTNEGLGYVGEGKGITVYAYVCLKRV
ncbi:MAG: 2-C-methyl-D-erythritol 2,4-cyclodiphosphate synthase [Clostridia bacterium]|nr:2-C-methyl-D-erythritol 2,4-cyclodiphosphate synthase [Clostridia bacterium]